MPDREFDHRKESAGMKTAIRQIEERMLEILQAAEDKITDTVKRWSMSKLQEQAEKAWNAIRSIEETGYCNTKHIHSDGCCNERTWKSWLHVNGFPARRPRVHTAAELAKQLIKGRRLPCLAQWIAHNVEAVTCPGCGKHTLHRERRMVCTGCGGVYPADKWAAGKPCDCGCMDARYYGIHSANWLGQLEFQQCQTPGCRWAGDYRRLTVQELADAAQIEAEVKLYEARTCPACGETSGNGQLGGVYLPIEECECGWKRRKTQRNEP